MMNKYEVLKDVISDYVKNMNKINSKRIDIYSKELEFANQECRVFNLLQQNMHKIEVDDGISQD